MRSRQRKEPLVALNVQIPESQKAKLDRLAEDECTSGAAIVRRALRLFLDEISTSVESGETTKEA